MLRLPRSRLEIAAELVALGGIAATVVLYLHVWPDLPGRVPTHFGWTGEPDAWGHKSSLLLLPIVMMGIYAGLTLLGQYPHVYNYPWRITEENAARQYRLARTMVSWMKAESVLCFTYVAWTSMRAAQGADAGLGAAFIPAFLLAIVGTLGIYFVAAARAQ